MASARADVIPMENVSVVQQSVTIAGYTRNVITLKPTSGTTGKVPVIFMLHYLNGNPADFADLTQMAYVVRNLGYWVILPYSGILQKTFSQQFNWNWKQSSSQDDDVAFLAGLITQTLENDPIDPQRVFMAGYSNGAAMSETFACMHPEMIAGIGLVASNMTTAVKKICNPSVGVPVIMFAGTEDPRVPYNGGLGQLSMAKTAQFWAQTAGCSTTPTGTDLAATAPDNTGTSVHLDSYGNCSGYGGVSFYTINGGGHTWPGTLDYTPQLGPVTQQISATKLMIQFFSGLARP